MNNKQISSKITKDLKASGAYVGGYGFTTRVFDNEMVYILIHQMSNNIEAVFAKMESKGYTLVKSASASESYKVSHESFIAN